VTDSGGRTCHAAIVARELGTPAIVGVRNGTKVLREKQKVTVSCAEGETGHVYDGFLPFEIEQMDLRSLKKPKTRIMMNIAQPDLAFKHSFIPNSGVGLARTEFIFTDYIKVHPLALMHMDKVDVKTRKIIDDITYPYKNKKEYFVDRLAEGIAMLASAFYPNDVIVRMSDFKTNEYASLIGGTAYEPKESNPMIGWRGASRYYEGPYREAFMLECKAIKKVREEMGLENVIVMIPFCRTPKEGEAVLKTMAEAGLARGKKGLKVYVMVEIPSNIILADKFADLFDGFSIGSNDLTQLTLGVDRDSELVSRIYDELNEAVTESIRSVIRTAKRKGVKVGICGQAPSDYPEFAKFLVRENIDSISLNPDSVYKTTQAILKTEQEIGKR
jgi:pyruvate,water dikinase